MKLQAALFADGSSAGVPERIAQLVERRRFILTTLRELISRIEKGSTPKTDLLAGLKQWADSLQPARRADPTAQATINQSAARGVIADTVSWLDSHSPEESLGRLRERERTLATSKPVL